MNDISGYVGYTRRHFHQSIEEHERSPIGKQLVQKHNLEANTLALNRFSILKKCQNKLDCLIYEMSFIKELKPVLNSQSDSICSGKTFHIEQCAPDFNVHS